MMKKDVFIVQGQKSIDRTSQYLLFLFAAVVVLGGCSVTSSSAPLAPRPPQFSLADQPREPITTVQLDPGVHDTGLPPRTDNAKVEKIETIRTGYTPAAAGCSIKSRFDREAALAYEWGEGGRNRLAVDVDGIGFDQFDLEQVRLEYKIRLQPEQTKKQKCRYASQWQGMIGSGYNELVLRENDTVWHELGDFEEDLSENLGDLFGSFD